MSNSHQINQKLAQALKPEQKTSPEPKPAAVLTVGLMGTGYHENSPGNLIKEVIRCVATGPTQSTLLIGGPGGVYKGESQAPLLGTHRVESVKYSSTTGAISVSRTPKSTLEQATQLGGMLKGTGYHQAIAEIVAVCQKMLAGGKAPLVINLVGFSRGADTAGRAAVILTELFHNQVEVNTFRFDPVAGAGRGDAIKACMIPPGVHEDVVVLMADENRLVFEAQDMSRVQVVDKSRTNQRYQIYPGAHCDAMVVLDAKSEMNRMTAKLGVDDLVKFLRRNGTQLKNELPLLLTMKTDKPVEIWEQATEYKPLTPETRFEYYIELKAAEQKKGTGDRIRNFVKNMPAYVLHGSDYFFNKEHQELFKARYPKYFDYFFQGNVENSKLDEVLEDIAKMQPHLLQTLRQAAYPVSWPKGEKPPQPKGVFLVAVNEILERTESPYQELTELFNFASDAVNRHQHLGSRVSQASHAVKELSTNLKEVFNTRPPSGTSPGDAQHFYKTKLKLMVAKAVINLQDVDYQGRLFYQLQNVLYADHTIWELIQKSIQNSSDQNFKKELEQLAFSIEKTFNDPKLNKTGQLELIAQEINTIFKNFQKLKIDKHEKKLMPQIFANLLQHIKEQQQFIKLQNKSTGPDSKLEQKDLVKNLPLSEQLANQFCPSYAKYMLVKLNDYVNSPRQTVLPSNLTKDRVAIANAIINQIKKIEQQGKQHQTGLLLSLIDTALQHTARLNRVAHAKKGKIDTLLRNMKHGLSGIKIIPLNDDAKAMLVEFNAELAKIRPEMATLKRIPQQSTSIQVQIDSTTTPKPSR